MGRKDPAKQVREWQRKIQRQQRQIDREVMALEREERKVLAVRTRPAAAPPARRAR